MLFFIFVEQFFCHLARAIMEGVAFRIVWLEEGYQKLAVADTVGSSRP